MVSKLSGVFRVRLVTKNIVLGSTGNFFLHLRFHHVKRIQKNNESLDKLIKESGFHK